MDGNSACAQSKASKPVAERMVDYNGTAVYCKSCGGAENALVLLHGWGASSGAMDGAFAYLSSIGRNVYALDFPGFGKSDFPPESWGVYEYADCVQFVLESLGLTKPVLIGHSFGGRIAIILGARSVASKLVLTDAAGLKPKTSLKKRWAVRRYKAAKRKGKAPANAGSADYAALSPAMKKVFVRIVNTHLDGLLEKIRVPTLLFWGKEDKDTPPYMARRLHKAIGDSGLVMLDGAGHFAYAERSDVFCAAVRVFTQ
ncbi:MAG: alpha/beta hydrolase [Clostridiales bacterium]|nr:alpha/beta hydrolase [Clostridiales bacterium]